MRDRSDPTLCTEPRCKTRKAKGRAVCHMHAERTKRAANPMRAAYRRLKDKAAQRAIPFRLTFGQFEAFALKTRYLALKGNYKYSLTIDRIDNRKGYQAGNIQALSRHENTMKFAKYDKIRMEKGLGHQ